MNKYLINIIFLICASPVLAQEAQQGSHQFELHLVDHRFEPAELTVPADTVITLTVHNQDDNFEEFHSDALGREKIIGPNKDGIIHIGPLSPGVYEFMGEFHLETAQGRIIVK